MVETACGVHKLVADVVAVGERKVLLVRYRDPAKYDGETGWFLPDDFLRFDEHPRDAARRVLKDQAGIAAEVEVLSHIESFTGGPEGAWHLIFHYTVELPAAAPVVPGPNVAEARWFSLGKLPPKKDVAHGGWAIETVERALEE